MGKLSWRQVESDFSSYLLGNLTLDLKKVCCRTVKVIVLPPQMVISPCLNQLHGQPNPISGKSDAPLDHKAYIQLFGDLWNGRPVLLILHNGTAAYNSQSLDSVKFGDELCLCIGFTKCHCFCLDKTLFYEWL